MDYSNFEFKLADLEERTGVFLGYASTSGNVDSQGDVCVKGCFARTLIETQGGKGLPILWAHDHREPVGVCRKAEEDRYGLAVEGELVLSVPRAAQARDLMKAGALKGLSIGYRVPPGGCKIRNDGVRELHDVDLIEWSLCVVGANERAVVTSPPKSLRAMHDAFRDLGFSKRECDRLVHACKSVLHDPEPDPNDLAAFLSRR